MSTFNIGSMDRLFEQTIESLSKNLETKMQDAQSTNDPIKLQEMSYAFTKLLKAIEFKTAADKANTDTDGFIAQKL